MNSMSRFQTQTVLARSKTAVARPEVCETDDEKHQMLLLSSKATVNNGTPSQHTGNYGTPSQHTGNNGTPSQHTGNNGTPSQHTGNNGTPSQHTGNNGTLSQHTGNNGTPSSHTGNNGTPSSHTGNNGTPSSHTGNNGTPSSHTGNNGTPSSHTGNNGTPSSHTGNNGTPSSHTGLCVKMKQAAATTEGCYKIAQQMISRLTIFPSQQALTHGMNTSVHSGEPTTQNKNIVMNKQESFLETDSDPSMPHRQSANIQSLNDFPNHSGICVSRNITQHISSKGNFSQLTTYTRVPVHIVTISSDSINSPVFSSPLQNSPIRNPPVFFIPRCSLAPSIQRPHLNNVVYPLQESKIYPTLPRKDSMDSGLSADGGSLQSSSLDSLSSINSCSISTESTPNKLDMLLINTDDDIELADSFTEHLKKELDIDDLTVDKFCDIGVGGTALQGLDTIHDRYSHILILVTDHLASDRHKRFLMEILLTCGLTEKNGKEDRVVPVWTRSDSKKKIFELSIIRGLDYHAFLTSPSNVRRKNYKECVRKLVDKGRQRNS